MNADHAAPGELRVLPVPGLPEFRPGGDLAGAIATAAPWLADDDVVVVTSKVVSKVEMPVKQSNLGRCFDLFVEMPLHVFIGVILMMATSPLLSTFTNPPASWNVDLMADQQMAGALAWSYGEPVALIIMVVFAMRWNRDETRTNAAVDKKAARDGDVDLEAYNEFLKTLPRR